MTLARPFCPCARAGTAPNLLTPVCGCSPKRFETLDLKEAKALLDELHD